MHCHLSLKVFFLEFDSPNHKFIILFYNFAILFALRTFFFQNFENQLKKTPIHEPFLVNCTWKCFYFGPNKCMCNMKNDNWLMPKRKEYHESNAMWCGNDCNQYQLNRWDVRLCVECLTKKRNERTNRIKRIFILTNQHGVSSIDWSSYQLIQEFE